MFLICFLWLLQPIIANEIIFQNKPIIQEVTIVKNKNLDQVRLNCDLEQGVQPLQFEWYFNNRKLNDNNKTTIKIRDDSSALIIKSLSLDDFGDYKCIIKNSYGEDAKTVSVYSKSKFYLNL